MSHFKVLEVNFKRLCYFGLAMPLGAFFACVLLSIVKDFKRANNTHCNVPNVFPSVSACISHFYPQKTIWQLAIGLDSFLRYAIAFVHYRVYYARLAVSMSNPSTQSQSIWLARLALLFHLIELTALIMLSFVSSVEKFFVHMLSFVVFIAASSCYMLVTIALHWPMKRSRELRALHLRIRLFGFYALAFVASLYFYVRHNTYCEPYVYSMFSLCEYVTILGNIAYHCMIIYDLDLSSNPRKLVLLDS